MKIPLLFLVFSSGLFSACSLNHPLEHLQVQAPADSDLVGYYAIVEETVSGRSLERTKFKDTRVNLAADGTMRFSEFPLFSHPAGVRGFFTMIDEPGRWIVTSNQRGYSVGLFREYGDKLNAVLTTRGNPIDLILYYGPREDGFFIKLRKL